LSGQPVDLRAIELTNALTGRNWSLLGSTLENESFDLRSPHPENLRLISTYGGTERAAGRAGDRVTAGVGRHLQLTIA